MVKAVLLVPTYNKGHLLPSFFSCLYKLNPQPVKTVFAENNSSDDTLKQVSQFKHPKELIRVWFRDDAVMISSSPYECLAHIRQLLLTRARQLDLDYAIFLDSDVLPIDRGLVQKLTANELDVVGGAYQRFFPYQPYPVVASVWKDSDGKRVLHEFTPPRLEEVYVTSAGCMCLSRRIIQDRGINFFPLFNKSASEDFGFCRQAREHGYNIWLDGTVKLEHLIRRSNRRAKPWTVDMKKQKYVPFYF